MATDVTGCVRWEWMMDPGGLGRANRTNDDKSACADTRATGRRGRADKLFHNICTKEWANELFRHSTKYNLNNM
jgi:hypothetical protein